MTVDGVTYGDWYLPSKYELNLLYIERATVGGFMDNYYWSSTEYNDEEAWRQYFYNSNQNTVHKSNTGEVIGGLQLMRVRAVRAF